MMRTENGSISRKVHEDYLSILSGPHPVGPPCMPEDCTMTRWKSCGSPGAPSGFMRSRRRRAETAPASCPASVMRVGSPPKAKMLR